MASDKEIRRLLALYFDGATTDAQEQELREFFARDTVPADLAYAKAMFGAFATTAADTCSFTDALLSERLLRRTEGEAECHPRQGRRVRLAALLTTVAAAVAVLCTLYLSDRRENTEIYCYLNGEPVTDIDIALRQVNMAERLLKAGVHSTATGADAIREAGRSLDALRTARNIMEHVKKAAEEVDSQEQPAGPAPRREWQATHPCGRTQPLPVIRRQLSRQIRQHSNPGHIRGHIKVTINYKQYIFP